MTSYLELAIDFSSGSCQLGFSQRSPGKLCVLCGSRLLSAAKSNWIISGKRKTRGVRTERRLESAGKNAPSQDDIPRRWHCRPKSREVTGHSTGKQSICLGLFARERTESCRPHAPVNIIRFRIFLGDPSCPWWLFF